MRQADALNILKAGRNVYLTGAAGSGKTYVLNQYISYLKDRGISVAITASTGIAATHIGGVTIHSWSGMGIKETLSEADIDQMVQKEHLFKRYEKTKVLIIDEVSMMHPEMFDALDRLARAMKMVDAPFGGIQIVLSGDFFQLPPVTKNARARYIDSSRAWKTMNVKVCYLEEQHRQESGSLGNILSEIRDGEISYSSQEIFEELLENKQRLNGEPTRLYTHNADVDAINEKELEKLPGELHSYEMDSSGKANLVTGLSKSILAPQYLNLKKDAIVMFVKNSFEEGYVNGTLGKVIDFEDGLPVVETYEGKKITVTIAKWEIEDEGKILASVSQLPIRLAWAITIHKSQGMSLDAAEVDLSKSFVPGQGYVALSRLRSIEGLTLLGLNRMALQVDPHVIELNKWLQSESSKWRKRIESFSKEEFKKMHEEFVECCEGTNDEKEIAKNQAVKEVGVLEDIVPSHHKTRILLDEEMSLEDMAKERKVTKATIISHLEKLQSEGEGDFAYLKPKNLAAMKKGFSKEKKLSDAHKKLKGKYTYEELRLARLFL
ncbi:MAG: AAA family ATPase [Patescibacteria group bacterium UBA2103]